MKTRFDHKGDEMIQIRDTGWCYCIYRCISLRKTKGLLMCCVLYLGQIVKPVVSRRCRMWSPLGRDRSYPSFQLSRHRACTTVCSHNTHPIACITIDSPSIYHKSSYRTSQGVSKSRELQCMNHEAIPPNPTSPQAHTPNRRHLDSGPEHSRLPTLTSTFGRRNRHCCGSKPESLHSKHSLE